MISCCWCLYGPRNYDYCISYRLIYRVGCAFVAAKIPSSVTSKFLNHRLIVTLMISNGVTISK